MADAEHKEMKTILFYIVDKNDGLKAIQALTNDIKADKDADHKLYFKFLMADTYYICMGCEDEDKKKHFIGTNEVIFMPSSRLGKLETSFNQNKSIIFQKNCMLIVGDGKKPTEYRKLLIDWLLERKKEIKL